MRGQRIIFIYHCLLFLTYVNSVSVLSDVFFSSHGLFSTLFFAGLLTFFFLFSMLDSAKFALAFAEYF